MRPETDGTEHHFQKGNGPDRPERGPLQTRINAFGDDADLKEAYGTERHLLYVACTRARDRLLVTGVEPGSEFLDDLRAGE